jgi:hypothetical protein
LPTSSPEGEPPEVDRFVETLARHGVEFLLVGGVATQAYGATRPTQDFDCVVRQASDNLNRLAAAMRELGARLRVEGLSDEEAAQLPVQLTAETLARMEISTWQTDAGALDVLVDMPALDGRHLRYEDLMARAEPIEHAGVLVQVASLEDIIASKRWADRPKDREALGELEAIVAKTGAGMATPGPADPSGSH